VVDGKVHGGREELRPSPATIKSPTDQIQPTISSFYSEYCIWLDSGCQMEIEGKSDTSKSSTLATALPTQSEKYLGT
jgi:hypothetical protein